MDLNEKITRKNEKITFKDYYKSLDEKTKTIIRDKILINCEMSYSSFYSKQTKEDGFSKLEKGEINRICEILFEW